MDPEILTTPALGGGHLYRRAYEKYADHPAVRDLGRELTFAELGRRARKLGSAFRSLGAGRGERVMLLGQNSCEWVETEHAITTSGAIRVALLTRLHAREVAEIAADIEPKLLVIDASWLEENGSDWIPRSIASVAVMGEGAGPEGAIPLRELVDSGADEEFPELDPDAVFKVIYTSGTTGAPKGVLVTHRTQGAMYRNALDVLPDIGPGDAALHTGPISHFSGGVNEIVAVAGCLNVLEPRFKAGRLIDVVEAGEITVLPLVPTQITMVLEELEKRGEPRGRFGNVKVVPYAASAIRPDRAAAAKRYFGDVLHQFYGQSETQVPITSLPPEDHVETENRRGLPRLASAGRVTRFIEVEIVDEDRNVLPQGEDGEIKVRSEANSSGYWNKSKESADTFVDGWVYTGDVGYIDENGYLFLLDRRKDMIISGGFNVYPREVENVISRMHGVREVAVVSTPDGKWGELITAVVSTRSDAELEPEQVIAFCRSEIAAYKVPKRVELVDELPKNGAGKIQKKEIQDRLWEGQARRISG